MRDKIRSLPNVYKMRIRRVESGDGIPDGGPHGRAAGMAGVLDDRRFSVGPGLGKFPCGEQRARVEVSVDQNSGNAFELVGAPSLDLPWIV
jgi:hypothetical protein